MSENKNAGKLKMDSFMKICLSIIILCCFALVALFMFGCQTKIGQVEWIENPQAPVWEEPVDLDKFMNR